jgi:prepilin-type N-terminal cleavage/methylation domain-containing protein
MRTVHRTSRLRGRTRRGVSLLEVVVALAVLGLAAASWVGLAVQSMHTVAIYHARELVVRGAARELAGVTLWSGEQFRQRIGQWRDGPFLLTVTELAPSVYGVVVADSSSAAPLLRTAFYARDTLGAAP